MRTLQIPDDIWAQLRETCAKNNFRVGPKDMANADALLDEHTKQQLFAHIVNLAHSASNRALAEAAQKEIATRHTIAVAAMGMIS